jgi:phytanoyl-CoA hydroxylase
MHDSATPELPCPLSPKEVSSWTRRGFLNAGPILDPEEIDALRLEYDRLVRPDCQVLGNERDGVYPCRAMLGFRSELYRQLIRDPRLLGIAVQLLGTDVRFWWDQGINKTPGAGSYIAWHQDNGYTNGRTAPDLACWLALDDSDADNGGLFVVPGSHRLGLLPHEYQGVHAVISGHALPEEPVEELPAKCGDLLLFSSYLVHQTVGNVTADRQRRAWVVQYCRGDQRNEDTGEVYDDRAWVVQAGMAVAEPWSERPFELK